MQTRWVLQQPDVQNMDNINLKKTLPAVISIIIAGNVAHAALAAESCDSGTADIEVSSVELVGEGTEESPYLIYNSDDLITFRDKVNAGETEICGKLMDDIVLNQNFDASKFEVDSYTSVTYDGGAVPETFIQWEPIGSSYAYYYNGTFDGCGYTISGLYINDPEAWEQALFGCIYQDATIKNLGLINSCIIAQNTVGGIDATNYYGKIINCHNAAVIAGNDTVGGVTAYSAGDVTGCRNTGSIKGESTTAGGIAGGNYGYVAESCNSGSVTGIEFVGGIAGMNDKTVENCYNTGEISGSSGVGGVVGVHYYGYINSCYNTGKVTGVENAGGITGQGDESSVVNCYYLEDNQLENSMGTMISREQLSVQDTFENSDWDFEVIWMMDDDLKQPVLQTLSDTVIRIAVAEYVNASEGYEINAVLTEPAENMTVLAALYDEDGSMISAACKAADGGAYQTLSIPSDKPGTLLKVFLWHNTAQAEPVCSVKSACNAF